MSYTINGWLCLESDCNFCLTIECPQAAISEYKIKGDIITVPQIDPNKCIGCGTCYNAVMRKRKCLAISQDRGR